MTARGAFAESGREMEMGKPKRAIGLMSGTSLDGIDAAVVETDGDTVFAFGEAVTVPYPLDFQDRLRALLGRDPMRLPEAGPVIEELTLRHVAAVERVMEASGLRHEDIWVVGFHGHTVLHEPAHGITRQIGDGALLARETGIMVVDDFRSSDIAAGGEGAPLVPVFHVALVRDLERPVAVLNIGGVANVTWISPDGGAVAFDTGPGNALIDDWVRSNSNQTIDEGGHLAHRGRVDEAALARLLADDYFSRPPPKSLDRNAFTLSPVEHLSVEDGAATLAAFTAAAVAKAQQALPAPSLRWLVGGGGRHNRAIMAELRHRLSGSVEPVEAVGWRGDALEAQAFAFLAARSRAGLPLSYPQTTGVSRPVTGGVRHVP